MSEFDDNNNIFSNSNQPEPEIDPWSIDSLQSDKDIYSSSDHLVHSELFESDAKDEETLSLTNMLTDETESQPAEEENDEESVSDKGKSSGKKAKSKKHKKPKSKLKRTLGIIGKTALSLFLVIVLTCTIALVGLTMWISNQIDSEENKVPLDLFYLQQEAVKNETSSLEFTSLVYAQNSEGKWEEIAALHQGQNRIWCDYTDLSPYLIDAVVSIEDKRFYQHEGVDWKRTLGALVNTFVDIYGGRQGGSTITQQLVKNLTQDDEISFDRKIREILKAQQVEKDYPKSTVMEWYVNTVYFGNGCHGIGTAARYYFGKEPSELTLLESASLAATIQTPSSINPLDGPQDNKDRRETCLSIMLEEGYITQEQHDEALKQELALSTEEQRSKMNAAEKEPNSYFIDALIDDLITDLMETKGWTYSQAENMVYTGGYRIYATVDPEVQGMLEETFEDPENFPINSEDERAQAAQTIMDYTGHVVAIVGGVGEKTADRVTNRAYYPTMRQPGSSIKPLAVYAPAIESNKWTYSTLVHDFHVKLASGGYYPKAAGSGKMVTIQKAIQSSLNSPSAQVCNMLSPYKSFDFLKKRFGLTTLIGEQVLDDGTVVSDINLSAMALGGMAYGVNVTEMTAAYATFGNLGNYYEPTTYYAVYDVMGELVLKHQEKGSTSITPETADVMNELMQTVITSGTGGAASLGSWPVFGKTGTTDNKHDCWFAGGTPYYVSVVWCGYDENDDLPGGANPAPGIFKKTMKNVMADLDKCDFNRSRNVVVYKYCAETGSIATDQCPKTMTGYYKNTNFPGVCMAHAGVATTEVTRSSPYGGTYANITQTKIPEYDAWKTNGATADTTTDEDADATEE